ncbi:MAG: hypothetical protein QXR87_04690 [Candidatus Hadarchaeales archaeon]
MGNLELRITITRKNVDKIVQLIGELLQEEESTATALSTEKMGGPNASATETLLKYLLPPPQLENLPEGKVITSSAEARYFGTLGLFNSFFPVKAVLRILAHMMEENGGKPVSLQQLVDRSIEVFRAAGLSEYRGFPTRRKGGKEKDSAIGRLVWHFIIPARNMGLLEADGEIPMRAWDNVNISITKQGWEFSRLENRVLDRKERVQVLSEAEREWMLDYLKRIDGKGYKEYSFLARVFEELKKGNTNMAAWLEKDEQFNEYVRSWSRKKENSKEFKKQLRNVATMLAQGKIALLRELGVISSKRKDYTVIGKL